MTTEIEQRRWCPVIFRSEFRGDLLSPVEILQGGVIMETFESSEYSPISRSLDELEPVLHGFSMGGEWKRPRLYKKESGGQPTPIGESRRVMNKCEL